MSVTEFVAQPGTLYIVATPIGNLRDITLRALDILKSVDRIAAEDTRVSAGLLAHYGIRAPLVAYHEHNEARATAGLLAGLQAGQSLAQISDAGTPGISDPGANLVRAARAAGIPVVPIPGVSAVATALSVAGLDSGPWLFHGFLPAKPAARRKTLEALRTATQASVFYEAPHRIVETVADLAAVFGPERGLFLGRELTKRFETLWSGPLAAGLDWLQADANQQRGEFVLVVEAAPSAPESDAEARRLLDVLLEELPASQAARLAARISGQKKNALYDLALKGSTKPQRDNVTE